MKCFKNDVTYAFLRNFRVMVVNSDDILVLPLLLTIIFKLSDARRHEVFHSQADFLCAQKIPIYYTHGW